MEEQYPNLEGDEVYLAIAAYKIGYLVAMCSHDLIPSSGKSESEALYQIATNPRVVVEDMAKAYLTREFFEEEYDKQHLLNTISRVSRSIFKRTVGASS